jgi:hypothetical protein
MFNSSNEQVWQFNIPNGAHNSPNGLAHFEARARELAATIFNFPRHFNSVRLADNNSINAFRSVMMRIMTDRRRAI